MLLTTRVRGVAASSLTSVACPVAPLASFLPSTLRPMPSHAILCHPMSSSHAFLPLAHESHAVLFVSCASSCPSRLPPRGGPAGGSAEEQDELVAPRATRGGVYRLCLRVAIWGVSRRRRAERRWQQVRDGAGRYEAVGSAGGGVHQLGTSNVQPLPGVEVKSWRWRREECVSAAVPPLKTGRIMSGMAKDHVRHGHSDSPVSGNG